MPIVAAFLTARRRATCHVPQGLRRKEAQRGERGHHRQRGEEAQRGERGHHRQRARKKKKKPGARKKKPRARKKKPHATREEAQRGEEAAVPPLDGLLDGEQGEVSKASPMWRACPSRRPSSRPTTSPLRRPSACATRACSAHQLLLLLLLILLKTLNF